VSIVPSPRRVAPTWDRLREARLKVHKHGRFQMKWTKCATNRTVVGAFRRAFRSHALNYALPYRRLADFSPHAATRFE